MRCRPWCHRQRGRNKPTLTSLKIRGTPALIMALFPSSPTPPNLPLSVQDDEDVERKSSAVRDGNTFVEFPPFNGKVTARREERYISSDFEFGMTSICSIDRQWTYLPPRGLAELHDVEC